MPTGVGDVRVRVRVTFSRVIGHMCPAVRYVHITRYMTRTLYASAMLGPYIYLSIYLYYPRLELLGLLALLGLEVLVVETLAIPEAAVL